MEIFIENERVKFTQGVQTFAIDYEGNQEELEWLASQLNTAFRNFMHETQIEMLNEYTEKTIKHFIKGGREKTDETSENGLHKHAVIKSVCQCSEPISQMTNNGMYCLRCENPVRQTVL